MSTASEKLAPTVRGFLHIFARFGVNNSAITNDRSQCCDAQSFDIRSPCCQSKMVISPLYNFVQGPVEVWTLMEKSPATRSKKTSAPDRPNCCKGGPGLQPWVIHLLQGWQGTSELSQPTSSSSRDVTGWHKVREAWTGFLDQWVESSLRAMMMQYWGRWWWWRWPQNQAAVL